MFNISEFEKKGYLKLEGYYNIDDKIVELAKSISTDNSYQLGRRMFTKNYNSVPSEILCFVKNDELDDFFKTIAGKEIKCGDVMVTYDYKHNAMERNKWLHFDRSRSLKAMVYLTDVGKENGPFSVVPGSQSFGAALRRKAHNKTYQDKPNRIELDYPELYKNPTPLLGKAGTLILFDSDLFHEGGKIFPEKERILIRSHWFVSESWRNN